MHACMYVRMYVRENEYIYVCNVSMHVSNIYAYIHAYMYGHAYIHLHVHACNSTNQKQEADVLIPGPSNSRSSVVRGAHGRFIN